MPIKSKHLQQVIERKKQKRKTIMLVIVSLFLLAIAGAEIISNAL